MAKQKQPPGSPMTLGNMRQLGVRGLPYIASVRNAISKRCSTPTIIRMKCRCRHSRRV
jgi:hypothetical protein